MIKCCLFISLAPRGSYKGRKQHVCKCCGTVHTDGAKPRRTHSIGRKWTDANGRECIYLGAGHEYANSGGWQYVYRFEVMKALNRRLLSTEHVDHIDTDKTNNDLRNLRVIVANEHGRFHANGSEPVVIAEYVEGRGFVELSMDETDYNSQTSDVPF